MEKREKTPANKDLTQDQICDWLQLSLTPRIGPVTFFKLIEKHGTPEQALRALQEPFGSKKGPPATPPPRNDIERLLDSLSKENIFCLPYADSRYPKRLRDISDPPPVLFAMGKISLLQQNCIAIVGARNASITGKTIAKSFAKDLGELGHVIVSGLARGIDTSAHTGSLNTGTIAVLASGIDIPYPPENEALHEMISEQGLLLSEVLPGTPPAAHLFPHRNRIISGLCSAVVVVEAAKKSGSLHTAQYAADQGREVCAVPGSPLDPRCQGTNYLLKTGATLVERASDIESELRQYGENFYQKERIPSQKPTELPGKPASQAHKTVLESISYAPLGVDELVRQCQMSPEAVQQILLDLELSGKLERHPGNCVSLCA